MDIFSNFATDESLEVEGRWVPLSKTAAIKVARAGNANYVKLLRKKLEENKIDLESGDEAANEVAEALMIEVMARTILVDFRGLTYKGADMPYSPINAKTLLGVKEFRKKVSDLSNNLEAYKVKQEEAQGND